MQLCGVRLNLVSRSFAVMDTQHIQGEGVPSQTGEGQSHHRPNQWYLSLQPTHCLPLPFPMDYKTGSWEMDRPGRKNL